VIKKYKIHKEEASLPFYCDDEHPFPYWEDYVCEGVRFYFIISKGEEEKLASYVKNLRRERDIVSVSRFFLKSDNVISRS
jgi:hypothetical protein